MSSTDHKSEPVIAAREPKKVDVEAGKDYWFCTCGRSQTQPFCDGSHSGTDFAPQLWTAEKSEAKWFCQVRHSFSTISSLILIPIVTFVSIYFLILLFILLFI